MATLPNGSVPCGRDVELNILRNRKAGTCAADYRICGQNGLFPDPVPVHGSNTRLPSIPWTANPAPAKGDDIRRIEALGCRIVNLKGGFRSAVRLSWMEVAMPGKSKLLYFSNHPFPSMEGWAANPNTMVEKSTP